MRNTAIVHVTVEIKSLAIGQTVHVKVQAVNQDGWETLVINVCCIFLIFYYVDRSAEVIYIVKR